MLYYLASHPNMVFTREQLRNGYGVLIVFGDSRTVDVHIKRLREKLPGCEQIRLGDSHRLASGVQV